MLFGHEKPQPEYLVNAVPVSDEDYASYGGDWYLQTMKEGDQEYNAAEMGITMQLTLGQDGIAVSSVYGEETKGNWYVEDGTVSYEVMGFALNCEPSQP